MFKISKSCKKWIFGPVKHEKFSRCLMTTLTFQYSKDFIMPTLSSLVAPVAVIMTASGATSDGKVGIMTTLGFQ